MIKKTTAVLIATLLSVPTAFAATYAVDTAHTQIHFTIPHLMVFKVRGNFNDFSGTVEVDPDKQTLTSAQATIQTVSIDTRNEKRDGHLRSADFFAVDQHPEITFVTQKISGSADDITVVGDLTIKGISKEITLKGAFLGAATDPWGNKRAGFEATGQIDRRDFGLTYNKALETGGVLVGDIVEIGLEVEAVAQQ